MKKEPLHRYLTGSCAILLVGLLPSCRAPLASKYDVVIPHLVTTDSYGMYYPPQSARHTEGDVGKSEADLGDQKKLMDAAYQSRKEEIEEILIYVHGGLISEKQSTRSAIDRTRYMMHHDKSIFPIGDYIFDSP